MTITLYGITASRASRPLWAAEELGLAYTHVPVRYQEGATRSDEFRRINPNGNIPVLVDEPPGSPEGRIVMWESMACTLYLARYHGKPDALGIAPATAQEDAQALRWSFWTMTTLEADALTVLMHLRAMPEARRKPALAEFAQKRIAGPLAVLEEKLLAQQQAGHAWLAGARFTVADLCVASVVAWLLPARQLLARHPACTEWLGLCLDRPAQQRVRAMVLAELTKGYNTPKLIAVSPY